MKSVSTMVLLVILAGAPAGCGEAAAPAPEPAGSDLRIAGPNHLATLFVEAMSAADAAAVARLCVPELASFFENLARIGEIHGRLAAFMRDRYRTARDTELRRLWTLEEAWKGPMTAFRCLELDGRLREEEGGRRVVYQLAHDDLHSRRAYPELVVERRGDRWQVVSFGPHTPQDAHVEYLRTKLARREATWKAAIAAVEREQPRSFTRALEVLLEALGTAPAAEPPADGDSR